MEIRKDEQMHNFSESSKSRMQWFEERQFGHPCNRLQNGLISRMLFSNCTNLRWINVLS